MKCLFFLNNLDEVRGIFFYKIVNQRMHNVHLLYKEYHHFFLNFLD